MRWSRKSEKRRIGNMMKFQSVLCGVVIALVGLAVKPLHFLYDYAWFVGFFTAAIVYVALMRLVAPVSAHSAAAAVAESEAS